MTNFMSTRTSRGPQGPQALSEVYFYLLDCDYRVSSDILEKAFGIQKLSSFFFSSKLKEEIEFKRLIMDFSRRASMSNLFINNGYETECFQLNLEEFLSR